MPSENRVARLFVIVLAGLLCLPLMAEDDNKKLQGSVELLYRDISVEGSEQKFEEDFDGLESGTYLSNLTLNWIDEESKFVDDARVGLIGLGGEPYEEMFARIGRQNKYQLRFVERKQDYRYNLFELIGDEDGHQWLTQRQTTKVGLSLYPTENLELTLDYQDLQRSGESVFMKDVSRDLFLMDTPLDYRQKRYTIGLELQLEQVNLVFRQMRRNYRNMFENSTEGDLGLGLPSDGDLTELESYDWRQNERGSADLTTLIINAPLGKRVDLTLGYFGTLVGKEELKSNVTLDGEGVDFTGTPLFFTDAFNDTDLEVDHTRLDADLSWFVVEPLSLHFQYRSLDRALSGTANGNLEGRTCASTGASCQTDADCDAILPGDTCDLVASSVNTRLDYSIDTATALAEIRPARGLTLTAGYRTIDRDLVRNGFPGLTRDEDFRSDGDSSLVLGVTWKATDWLTLNADYEEGELDRAFTSTAPFESERLRFRATIQPDADKRLGLTYLDYENTNTARPTGTWYGTCAASGGVCSTNVECDAITPGDTCTIAPFDHSTEGTNWSAAWWHRANESVDYLLRYAEQAVDSSTAVLFDGPGFGGPAAFAQGNSIFDNTNTQWTAQVNFTWATPWRGYVRYWYSESDGNNILSNNNPAGFSNDELIAQEFTDGEVGLTYSFSSGLYVGGRVRAFDYDDDNDLLDYDGTSVVLVGGVRF